MFSVGPKSPNAGRCGDFRLRPDPGGCLRNVDRLRDIFMAEHTNATEAPKPQVEPEPQNELTKKFTDQERAAVNELRVRSGRMTRVHHTVG